MKSSFWCLAFVAMTSLSGFCIGRNAQDEPARDVQQPRAGTVFRGTIGDAKVEMDIKRDGEHLTGTYYYLKSGSANRLNLNGTIAADGSFTMQETDAAGKKTGEFKGKWKQDPYQAGAAIEGEWLKPGQKRDGTGFGASEQMIFFTTTEITTREIKESIKTKRAQLSADYPELSGGANDGAFNQLVKADVMRLLTGFRKDMAGLTAADIKQMSETGYFIDISYDVEYADEDLISVLFSVATFTGGAHPNQDSFTVTYDLKHGRELKLADLFKPGSPYLTTISAYVIRDLKGRKDPESGDNMGLAQDVFEGGADPVAENYQNWNITKKGLLITFPPYQVSAYVYGTQTAIVPYSQLKNIAAAGGPLAKSNM